MHSTLQTHDRRVSQKLKAQYKSNYIVYTTLLRPNGSAVHEANAYVQEKRTELLTREKGRTITTAQKRGHQFS